MIAAAVLLFGLVGVSCSSGGAEAPSAQAYSMRLPDNVESADGGFVDYENFIRQYLQTGACLDGIIQSPYYEVSAVFSDGSTAEVYSYSVPAVNSELHSFGYIEATKDKFPMTITVEAKYAVNSAVVVPEKFGPKKRYGENISYDYGKRFGGGRKTSPDLRSGYLAHG